MKTLNLDAAREIVPELDELRPLMDHLIAASEPDPSKAWSGSGSLGTVGARLVSGRSLADATRRLAEAEAAHLQAVFTAVGVAVERAAEGDAAAAARALLEAAALEEARHRPDRAEAYAGAAYRVARREKDLRITSLALRRWARAARAVGRLEEARERYASAHQSAEALGDVRGAAEAAIGAGNVLEEQGRWSEAHAWYRAALALVEGDVPERLHALVNLHIVTRSAGNLDQSVPWLEEAERVARIVDPEGAGPFLENARGQLQMARGDFDGAERHLRSALDTAPEGRARVTILLNLSEALLAQGRTLEAAEHAREAEREAIAAALVSKLPEVYRLLGRIAVEDGEADAFVLFERALEITRDWGLPSLEEALTLHAYSQAEARNGDQEAARSLREAAEERLRALGITHMRQSWADTYGDGTEVQLPGFGENDGPQ